MESHAFYFINATCSLTEQFPDAQRPGWKSSRDRNLGVILGSQGHIQEITGNTSAYVKSRELSLPEDRLQLQALRRQGRGPFDTCCECGHPRRSSCVLARGWPVSMFSLEHPPPIRAQGGWAPRNQEGGIYFADWGSQLSLQKGGA